MDQLVSWLEDNLVDHIKLFLDSSQDAKMANWKKIVGKESKTYIHVKIAHTIFSADNNPQICNNYAQYIDKCVRVVDNHLQMYVQPPNHIH
jgi:hypothetical protein